MDIYKYLGMTLNEEGKLGFIQKKSNKVSKIKKSDNRITTESWQ